MAAHFSWKFLTLLVQACLLLKCTIGLKGCISEDVPCYQNVTAVSGEDLSLTCMVGSNKPHYMYCGEKGSGIHFKVKWFKDRKDIKSLVYEDTRLVLENDEQTLSLVPAKNELSGHYLSTVEVFYLKEEFYQTYCRNEVVDVNGHPHHFTSFDNVSIAEKHYSGEVDKWNCSFDVLIKDDPSKKHLSKTSPYPWKLSTIYIFENEEQPSVNFRYKKSDFVAVEAKEYSWFENNEEYLRSIYYQEISTTVEYHQPAIFTCHIRTSVPLTDRIWWDWHEGNFSKQRHHNLTETPIGKTWNVTQRRWSLIVWNITDQGWDYSNLSCYVVNNKGIAKVLHKVELLGNPLEKDLMPWLHYLEWCYSTPKMKSKICEKSTSHEGTQAFGCGGSMISFRFCTTVSSDHKDRVKLTFNAVPRACRSYNKDNQIHSCYHQHYVMEIQGFDWPRKEKFCVDTDEWWPDNEPKHLVYPNSSGYAWFWKVYPYKMPDHWNITYIWLNVSEAQRSVQALYCIPENSTELAPLATPAKLPDTGLSGVIKGTSDKFELTSLATPAKSTDTGLSEVIKGMSDEFKNSKHHLLYNIAGIGGLVLVIFLGLLCFLCYTWNRRMRRNYFRGHQTCQKLKLRTKKLVRIGSMQNNCMYGMVGQGDNSPEAFLVPKIDIETISQVHVGSNLVCRCEYQIPRDVCWEHPREKLTLGSVIGEGYFGLVRLAIANDIVPTKHKTIVAVKMLKDTAGDNELRALLAEIAVMKTVSTGENRNVIKLLGCCTQDGPIYAILEHAEHGNLKSYLQTTMSRTGYSNTKSPPLNRKALHPTVLTVNKLNTFALQIANGMKYISSLKIVHRDLAARNILVTSDLTLKITDFGFTRILNNSEYYRTINKGVFPVKWMSPEAITDQKYTTKSDVWSFGILLWEIFSLGSIPYPDVLCDVLLHQLMRGYRINRPENCPFQLYEYIMLACWDIEPENRPSFHCLYSQLQQYMDKYNNDEECRLPKHEAVEGMLVLPRRKTASIAIPKPKESETEISNEDVIFEDEEIPVVDRDPVDTLDGSTERIQFESSVSEVNIADDLSKVSYTATAKLSNEDLDNANNNIQYKLAKTRNNEAHYRNERPDVGYVKYSRVKLSNAGKLYVRFPDEDLFNDGDTKKDGISSDDDDVDSAVGLGSMASPSQSSMCYSPPTSPSFSLNNNDTSDVFF